MSSREQDIADDKAFFRNIYIFLGIIVVVFSILLYFGWADTENFLNEFNSWDCKELKNQLTNDHSQYREQLILKKLHLEDCYK